MRISKKTFALIMVLTMLIASFSAMSVSAEDVSTSDETQSTVGAYVDPVTTTTSVAMDEVIEGVVGDVVDELEIPDLSGSANGFIEMFKSILSEIRTFFEGISEAFLSIFGTSSTVVE